MASSIDEIPFGNPTFSHDPSIMAVKDGSVTIGSGVEVNVANGVMVSFRVGVNAGGMGVTVGIARAGAQAVSMTINIKVMRNRFIVFPPWWIGLFP